MVIMRLLQADAGHAKLCLSARTILQHASARMGEEVMADARLRTGLTSCRVNRWRI